MLTCRYTRARLTAFINQELPASTRRYVARHLDHCPACRAHYKAQKGVRQTLMIEVPRLGQPAPQTLATLWTQITADLQQPAPTVTVTATRRPMLYGIAAGAASLMLLASMALHWHAPYTALSLSQPAPLSQADETSPALLTAATQIAFVPSYEALADAYKTPEWASLSTPEASAGTVPASGTILHVTPSPASVSSR